MTDAGLTQAELFDVFSNARRRRTVEYLKRQNGSCDLSSLVEHVAAWENDADPEEVTRAQRRRVYISLYQTHLPMLEDHGIIDWDPDGHEIELLPSEETFEPYLDGVGDDRPWHYAYATATVAAAVALGLSWLSVGSLSVALAPWVALALCCVVLFLALAQRVSRRSSLPVLVPLVRR
ncbi:DUF7344 domain-containing protein [Salinilacihabitans rarus]|uniref:DUF7344 domain-containing protein n=1 Tax=Salinilacihabitans rarus TaxID=2961596 RepID=UPI0020C89711|nr:hypothetical protein [Salinilacihabitans rarus]